MRVLVFSVLVLAIAGGAAPESSLIWVNRDETDDVASVAFSPDGKFVAVRGVTRVAPVVLKDVATGRTVRGLGTHPHCSSCGFLAYFPDGSMVASGDKWEQSGKHEPSCAVDLFDVASRKRRLSLPHPDYVCSVAISPDGKLLASTCYYTELIWIWDVTTGKNIHTLKAGSIKQVTFSPDGKTLASADWGKSPAIRFWDVASGKNIATINSRTEVWSVAFSPDGKTLASSGWDPTISLWDVASRTKRATLTSKSNSIVVYSVTFSPDGKTLASGGAEAIETWSLESRKATIIGKAGVCICVAFSPDGKRLAAAHPKAGAVTMWRVAK